MLAGFSVAACGAESEDDALNETSEAVIAAQAPIAPDLNANSQNQLGEISGLAASVQYPGFVWMHRDGYAADRPSREFIYAMKIVDRKLVPFTGASGTYPTREFSFSAGLSIANNNWEDMALGTDVTDNAGTSLYVGDIGNNGGGRNLYQVYQFQEPNPTGTNTVIGALQATWKFAYPTSAKLLNGDYPNCETMFYLDRNLYILTKESSPRVYRFPPSFYTAPSKTHTLEQVGGTTRLVGGGSNPSYAGFSSDHQRFMVGSHGKFFVYKMAANTLVGDALVKAMLLTAGNPDDYNHAVGNPVNGAALNTEGGTFEAGTKNLILATESKKVFHWPQASIETP